MRRMSASVSAAALAIALAAPAMAQVTPGQPGGGIGTTPGQTGTLPGQQPLPGDIGSGIDGPDTDPPASITGQQVDPTIPDVDDGSPGLSPDLGLGAPGTGGLGTPPGTIGDATGAPGEAPLGAQDTPGFSQEIPGTAQDPTLGGIAPGVGAPGAAGEDVAEPAEPGDSPVLGADEPLDGTTPGLDAPGEGIAGGVGPDLGTDDPAATDEAPLATGDGTGFGSGAAGAAAEDGETESAEPLVIEGEADGTEVEGDAASPEAAGDTAEPSAAAAPELTTGPGSEAAETAPAAGTTGTEAPTIAEDVAEDDAAHAGGVDAAETGAAGAGQMEGARFATLDVLHDALGAIGAEDRVPFAGTIMRGTTSGGAPVLVLIGPEDFADDAAAAAMPADPLALEQALGEAGLQGLVPDPDMPVLRATWEDHVVFAMEAAGTAPGIAGHDAAAEITGTNGDADGLEDAFADAGIEPEDGFEPRVFRAVQADTPLLLLFTGTDATGGVEIDADTLRERLEEAGLSDVERLDEDLRFVRGAHQGDGIVALGGDALRQDDDVELAPN